MKQGAFADNGRTAFQEAAEGWHEEFIQMPPDVGADIDGPHNVDSWTVLQLAGAPNSRSNSIQGRCRRQQSYLGILPNGDHDRIPALARGSTPSAIWSRE